MSPRKPLSSRCGIDYTRYSMQGDIGRYISCPVPLQNVRKPDLPQAATDRKDIANGGRVVPFQIRGRSFTAIVLELSGAADGQFYAALDEKLKQAPHFFQNAPFVLDLDRADGVTRSGDMMGLVRELRSRKLSIIGVQNGTFEQNTAALSAGLAPLQGGREVNVEGGKAEDGEQPEEPAPGAGMEESLLITEPVRSGQRVFADRGDLVVVASVSSGAELIAQGNIHVYGSLRGRALAGVNGDVRARVFCQSLEAELIAIAGLYKTSDDLGPDFERKRVQAFLEDDTLRVELLK